MGLFWGLRTILGVFNPGGREFGGVFAPRGGIYPRGGAIRGVFTPIFPPPQARPCSSQWIYFGDYGQFWGCLTPVGGDLGGVFAPRGGIYPRGGNWGGYLPPFYPPPPGLILLFYLVFYGFLAGLFALTMWVMLQSVDPHVPKYQDRLATPGMMIRPRTEGLDVTFNVTQSQTWRHYVRALHQFLEPYNDSVQAARNAACVPGRYNEQPDDAVPNYPKRACRFNRSLLGPCAGLAPADDYGYGTGQPCVLLKVNRVINFFPGRNKSINVICVAKVTPVSPPASPPGSPRVPPCPPVSPRHPLCPPCHLVSPMSPCATPSVPPVSPRVP
uniref:Sodium/potassium-transporting ATPase subunit beta n=1 Tax=Strix occidentalis caurina TaxID=311401 RepID=A0A8D0G2D2_STROC